MNYKDIIYPCLTETLEPIIEEIKELLDIEEDETKQEQYDGLMDINDEIISVYSKELGNPCLQRIQDEISNIPFSLIASSRWDRFNILLHLGSIIKYDGTIDLDSEIVLDKQDFMLKIYSGNDLPLTAFAHFNNENKKDSVAYLKPNTPNIKQKIIDNGFNIPLLALFIYFLSQEPDIDLNLAYLLYRLDAENQKSAESSLKMLETIQGKVIHVKKMCSTQSLPNYLLNRVSPLQPYNQFEEMLVILSELNDREDILGKLLSVYHVIENFMFKIPLVNLGHKNDGRIFSIRDFRRLFDTTSLNEIKAIEHFFNKEESGGMWNKTINERPFRELVSHQVSELSESHDEFNESDCDSFLSKLNIKKITTYENLCHNLNANTYAHLVYKIRCAIVHNKETELHISHFNLDNTIAFLIDAVVIKPLQHLSYELLTDNSSKVWYTGPELQLYQA